MRSLFIDRDGVINEDSYAYIKSPDEWRSIPGSLEAIACAQRAGFRIIVVSNQSGIARGLLDITTLNAIHRRLIEALARLGGRIDAFLFCPHQPEDRCQCRKPKAGLLLSVQQRLGIDLTQTTFIGDQESDVAAAKAVGARPILVRTGLKTADQTGSSSVADVETYDTLRDAVNAIVASV